MVSLNVEASEGLDIESWLRRPGVNLVVVEFYATWCKPCMEAVPKWKALHDEYRDDGLRLIVVATQDADGACANPGWSPDLVVCDDDGFLAQRFGVDTLPAAYLWGWQGHLLAKQVHVDEVEAKAEEWMRKSPRVDVQVDAVPDRSGIQRQDLLEMIRAELKRSDKLVVVATEAERKALRRLIRRSLRASSDSALECEVGKEVSANSLLEASITGRKRVKRLQLQLLAAERGCLVAAGTTRWNPDKPSVSVGEAVSELVGRLRLSRTQYPWASDDAVGRAGQVRSTDYQALLRQAQQAEEAARQAKERAAQIRRKRLAEINEAWRAVSKAASVEAMSRARRIEVVEQFMHDFPDDNPHLAEAERMLAELRAGREPRSRTGDREEVRTKAASLSPADRYSKSEDVQTRREAARRFAALEPEYEAFLNMEITLRKRELIAKVKRAEELACDPRVDECRSEGKYWRVVHTGDPWYGLAARLRMVQVYESLGRSIASAPVPSKLTVDQRRLYRAELEAVASGPYDKARSLVSELLQHADSLDLSNSKPAALARSLRDRLK